MRIARILGAFVLPIALGAPTWPQSTPSRRWVWDKAFRAGACAADDVTVDLRSTGTGTQRSVTWTSGAGSSGWWWSIEGLDARQSTLWRTAWVRGPRLNEGHPPPRYRFEYDFAFPATRYLTTASLRLRSRC